MLFEPHELTDASNSYSLLHILEPNPPKGYMWEVCANCAALVDWHCEWTSKTMRGLSINPASTHPICTDWWFEER